MKGEKIAQVTTDIGTIVAVVTFFGCVGYLLLDLRIVMLDGWGGIWLRGVGIAIMIFCGYAPYWLMSVFFKYMQYPFLGFGGSVGFAVGDLSMRIFVMSFGIFHTSGYIMFVGAMVIFVSVFFLLILGDRSISWFVVHQKKIKMHMMHLYRIIGSLVSRRIL